MSNWSGVADWLAFEDQAWVAFVEVAHRSEKRRPRCRKSPVEEQNPDAGARGIDE